ncbi:SH3 domain-containing protein [Oryzicola mucosus]|uniref:SH3 domain-containing protein n=1 Tax=Oryzicola mucosus TaxID=2767425 RepID=A0A8J6PQ79_9HYPH|nr:SH3 domain-containing protein [Oryzicola mucosus]MBD0415935.1 SH3 domain-containing protein [Oryzicola mucosus]
MNGLIKTGVAVVLASTMGFFAAQADASAFVAWTVKDVAFGDTLNIRKFPASTSQKQAAYPNGTVLQMTGTCTGGINLFDISGMPAWKQRQKVRYSWCQVWHDPARNGDFVTGWVYGKYIAPR